MTVFLIMTQCDNGAAYAEIDQIVETLPTAQRESVDLSRMGCGPIRIYQFAGWEDAQNYTDEKDARYPSPKLAKLVSTRP
jgi:hypothetical protein